MSKYYTLSEYKFLINFTYRSPLRKIFIKNNISYDLYFSLKSGIYLKNNSTKVTEKLLNISDVKYIDIIYKEDNYYLLYITSLNELYIRYIKNGEYNSKRLYLNTDKIYLELYDNKILLLYQNKITNKLEYCEDTDEFESIKIISENTFEKQSLIDVENYNSRLYFYMKVIDNSLLKNINNYLFLKNKSFIEIPTDLGEYHV